MADASSTAEVRVDGGRLDLVGELSFETVPGLLAQCEDMLRNIPGDVQVNLEGVSRSDSAGLALLVELVRMKRAEGKTVTFSHVPEQMQAMALVSRLEEVLGLTA
ncbi:MAG: STAS domain-containing protein [Gammaproteobacteria bacterium]|nr:STAS domain-containing protein [Gammaproteobacteria bacterium]